MALDRAVEPSDSLDFAPGARVVYSNFGYLLPDRVIERAAGVPSPPASVPNSAASRPDVWVFVE